MAAGTPTGLGPIPPDRVMALIGGPTANPNTVGTPTQITATVLTIAGGTTFSPETGLLGNTAHPIQVADHATQPILAGSLITQGPILEGSLTPSPHQWVQA